MKHLKKRSVHVACSVYIIEDSDDDVSNSKKKKREENLEGKWRHKKLAFLLVSSAAVYTFLFLSECSYLRK